MSIIATICARGGSVGVPGKNIKLLNGKPLICYSIEQAKQCDFIDEVYVSTDDEAIATIAQSAGAKIPFIRPSILADDKASKLTVIQHLVTHLENQHMKIEVIVDLGVPSPLREIKDIEETYKLLTPEIDLVITGYLSNKNPYFSMVEEDEQGFVNLSKRNLGFFDSRQTSPKVFAMNGSIYVWQRHALNNNLWDNQRIKLYEMPEERSIDIDTHLDWKIAQLLLNEKLTCKI